MTPDNPAETTKAKMAAAMHTLDQVSATLDPAALVDGWREYGTGANMWAGDIGSAQIDTVDAVRAAASRINAAQRALTDALAATNRFIDRSGH